MIAWQTALSSTMKKKGHQPLASVVRPANNENIEKNEKNSNLKKRNTNESV